LPGAFCTGHLDERKINLLNFISALLDWKQESLQ